MKSSQTEKPAPAKQSPLTGRAESQPLEFTNSSGIWDPGTGLVKALYQRAAALERRWPGTSVSDTPGRMVEAVLRHVQRLLNSAQISSEDARDPRRLTGLLDAFWARNARRDYARSRARTGRADPDSLKTMPRAVELVYEDLLMHRLLGALVEGGHRKEVAYGYLLSCQGDSCQEISEKLSMSTSFNVQPSTVRQWKRRTFPKLAAQLRRFPDLFSMEVR